MFVIRAPQKVLYRFSLSKMYISVHVQIEQFFIKTFFILRVEKFATDGLNYCFLFL